MTQGAKDPAGPFVDLEARLVRYTDLKPCTTAFIDTRTPGSAEKENFTIIGPGVAENPDQHVHIDIPHGFNIGAARQPPGCINSQHSHETAEVFVVHSGRWAFLLGPNQEDGEVLLEEGDIISIPVNVFRGFKNVGDDVGFLFAILGGDDPGHVTWAPYVFDAAAEHGLILLEDGSLVDTQRGEKIPDDKKAMAPTTEMDVAKCRTLSADELADCVATRAELEAGENAFSVLDDVNENAIIGEGNHECGVPAGKLHWSHGFHLSQMQIPPGTKSVCHSRIEEEVLFVHAGVLSVEGPDETIVLRAGDTFTTPIGMPRRFVNNDSKTAIAYVVRAGDKPSAVQVIDT